MADKHARSKRQDAHSSRGKAILTDLQLQTLFGRPAKAKAPAPAKPLKPAAKAEVKPAPKPVPAKPAPKATPKPALKAPPAVKASAVKAKPAAPKEKPVLPSPEVESKPLALAPGQPDRRAPLKVKLPDPVEWNRSMGRIAEQSQKVIADFIKKQEESGHHSIPMPMFNSMLELTSRMLADPVRLMRAQTQLWHQYVDLWQRSTMRFLGEHDVAPIAKPEPVDKRFKDAVWQENPMFDYIKQSYLLTAHWLQGQVKDLDGLSPKDKKKIEFYTRQLVDALSPTNFALTNPQVLRATLESGGENLLAGLSNLLEDLDQGKISMTDESAFEVGRNLAVTPGSVVFQNELFQLIEYTPTTPNVAKRPLLIVPPWINKYYILDLKPENSFIKWAVDQGLTVYCMSWVNPDASLKDYGFEDYMTRGLLTAIEQVQKLSGEQKLNLIGYCLGGTLTASTLAYLHATAPKKAADIASVTYFTTLVDFRDAGELSIFIDEDQIESIEKSMAEKGYLDASAMASTFNLLRANDLIWSFVVNNYLLGKEPFPFDLLYWNGDSTRMPAAMHSFYLRNMYQHNRLIKPRAIKLKGVPIDLTTIKTPTFILSTREDHIAPWQSTYAGTQAYKGSVHFCLAGSGHIAGVVNPPSKEKYSYWTNSSLPQHPHEWLENATEHQGSWWPHWRKWLELHDGGDIPARKLPKGIEPAPGSYVKVRAL